MENIGAFSVIWTGDGSPSLRGDSEPMHHLGGAYAETQYIYGDAIRLLSQRPELLTWNVLVVGLGLGYIELLATAESLLHNKKLKLLSYEIKQELVTNFIQWLNGTEPNQVYEKMYSYFQTQYPGLLIKEQLWTAYQNGSWEIRGALDETSLPNEPYHGLMFDAFSGKSTPSLWTEDFLIKFLKSTVSEYAVFSTYACTGVLRRTLQAAHFKVEKRLGFLGKRNSTMAVYTKSENISCEVPSSTYVEDTFDPV